MGLYRITPRALRPAILVLVVAGMVHGADISGPALPKTGEIIVLTAHLQAGSRHRWILPDGLEPVARTANQIALVVGEPGLIEILLVEVTSEEITLERFSLDVRSGDQAEADSPETVSTVEVDENPADDPAVISPSAAAPQPKTKPSTRPPPQEIPKQLSDEIPMVVMYSRTSPPCPHCDRWMANEHPKLLGTKWRFAKLNNATGVSSFPSFEIRANGQKRYFSGYLTAAQIFTEITSMESAR